MSTIFALATPPGVSGVAVVRISGPKSKEILEKLGGSVSQDRVASLRNLYDEASKLLDQALVLTFSKPNSFTGEDVVELHLHGSRAVTQAVINYLARQPGLRMAQEGEFTRRSLQNGKMDLTQVEALGDLLHAETEIQRSLAQETLSGSLKDKVGLWRGELIRAASLIEVTIDFADEEVPEDVLPEVRGIVDRLVRIFKEEIDGVHVAERLRNGFEVAIIGAPNVGKSSLINALAQRDVAITSEVSGTTRDVIEVQTDLGGLPITFLDTAGLRETVDEVEKIGVRRGMSRAREADLRIFLYENKFDPIDFLSDNDLVFHTKGDLYPEIKGAISTKSGYGIDVLCEQVQRKLSSSVLKIRTASHKRHESHIRRALKNLEEFRTSLEHEDLPLDILAELLRSAINDIESLIGLVGVEHLLDEIFASFCLGK